MIHFNGTDIPISAILNAIHCDDNVISVIAYWSKMDGLGNKHSDIDLYVITRDNKKVTCDWDYVLTKISCLYISNVKFDIEYWEYENLIRIIEQIHNNSLVLIEDTLKLTVLSRIFKGICIYGDSIKEKINFEELKDYVIYLNRWSCKSNYDDAKRFYDVEDYLSALASNSFSIIAGITAYNALNGKVNLQPKWAPKIFVNIAEQFLLEQYLNSFIFINATKERMPSIVADQLKTLEYIIDKING